MPQERSAYCPLFLLLLGCCRELFHARTLPSRGRLAWAGAWGRPGLGPGNQHQEEPRSGCPTGSTSRAPSRLAPSGQALPSQAIVAAPPAPGAPGREQRRGRGAAQPAPVASTASEHRDQRRRLAVTLPPGLRARLRLGEKRALERASPWPGARDRGSGANVGAPWKVTAAGARRAGRSTVGAGNPGGRPPPLPPLPPPPPPRRAGFPERSGL